MITFRLNKYFETRLVKVFNIHGQFSRIISFLPGIPEKATKLMKQIKERRLFKRKIELISLFQIM